MPARFTLIAAMNPCPCGYALDPNNSCRCAHEKRQAYSRRISGPLLDRMDMTIVLDRTSCAGVSSVCNPAEVVERAVDRQRHRFQSYPGIERNADVKWGAEWDSLGIPDGAESWIRALSKEPINLRLIHKLMRVARTIADIDGCEAVDRSHFHEAWDLRCRYSNISIGV